MTSSMAELEPESPKLLSPLKEDETHTDQQKNPTAEEILQKAASTLDDIKYYSKGSYICNIITCLPVSLITIFFICCLVGDALYGPPQSQAR